MSPDSQALIVCADAADDEVRGGLDPVVPRSRSALAACSPDSRANKPPDSARLRASTALASRALNSSRPTRASSAMARTRLVMPARFCSSAGAAATAAWVVAAMSATTQSKTAPTNSSLSAKLS